MEEEKAYNFALYSKHAESVELCFFNDEYLEKPLFRYAFDFLLNKSGPVWHCRLPLQKLDGARFYAYRVGGPAPAPGYDWHTFDAEKLLLDPYATAVYFPPGFDRAAAARPGSNMGRAPLGLLQDGRSECAFSWDGDARPHHDSDLVIYELHVRGFTRDRSSGVPEERAGTFSGAIEKIPYLKELGITAVELMPVFQFDPQEENYWGYMPLNFFAPHESYSVDGGTCGQRDEFRRMVKAFHEAGIEVILDVVFNHTGEGDHRGPTYSLKGIDNSTYYMLSRDPAAPYANYSGTGNTLHTRNRAVRQLIIDSLLHWVRDMHVDGFRFDLASIFNRGSDGSVSLEDPPIFGEILSHPELSDIRLIAEPWDAGGLFQLGRRFPGTLWMQWNAQYRDTLQRFVRGDTGMVGDLMTRLYGSSDLFPDDRAHAFHPFQSVNYVSSHDGFTLYDLTAYNHKNNWANGHGNTDGSDGLSWNCGWEGDEDLPPEILELRKRQAKNFFCLLMLSNGTPMFRMGDEFLNTQHGNNNPYNQDNETTWLDWGQLETHRDAWRFFKEMIAFRKRHPSLCRSRFWREDIHWYGVKRNTDLSRPSRQLAFWLSGKKQDSEDIYVMINAAPGAMDFGIHEGVPGEWRRVIDTGRPSPEDILEEGTSVSIGEPTYEVSGRSVVVLARKAMGE